MNPGLISASLWLNQLVAFNLSNKVIDVWPKILSVIHVPKSIPFYCSPAIISKTRLKYSNRQTGVESMLWYWIPFFGANRPAVNWTRVCTEMTLNPPFLKVHLFNDHSMECSQQAKRTKLQKKLRLIHTKQASYECVLCLLYLFKTPPIMSMVALENMVARGGYNSTHNHFSITV